MKIIEESKKELASLQASSSESTGDDKSDTTESLMNEDFPTDFGAELLEPIMDPDLQALLTNIN